MNPTTTEYVVTLLDETGDAIDSPDIFDRESKAFQSALHWLRKKRVSATIVLKMVTEWNGPPGLASSSFLTRTFSLVQWFGDRAAAIKSGYGSDILSDEKKRAAVVAEKGEPCDHRR